MTKTEFHVLGMTLCPKVSSYQLCMLLTSQRSAFAQNIKFCFYISGDNTSKIKFETSQHLTILVSFRKI